MPGFDRASKLTLKMKKIFVSIALMAAVLAAQAQNTQEAAAAAAAALSAADDVPEKVEKPKYWTNTILTNINFGQTYLNQWAAGGYNNLSLAGNVDASANYAKGKLTGVNRIQLDYGFLWSADKPILQKNKDRMYLESKWGYETPVRHLSYSASFDFLNQFGHNYDYKTPATKYDENGNQLDPTAEDWLEARKLKSGFLAPAYMNLGLGVLWTPAPWFSLNFAPLTGSAVFVTIPELRYTYGMDLKNPDAYATEADARKAANTAGNFNDFRAVRMEFGAQLKADASWVFNDNLSLSTQLTLFYNYLKPKVEPRITWDNKVYWKLAKFFALTVSTNLIYDPLVHVRDTDKDGKADAKGVQFKEFLEFGFTYSFSHQR